MDHANVVHVHHVLGDPGRRRALARRLAGLMNGATLSADEFPGVDGTGIDGLAIHISLSDPGARAALSYMLAGNRHDLAALLKELIAVLEHESWPAEPVTTWTGLSD